jgi:DnaJ-domain-containing protein 1
MVDYFALLNEPRRPWLEPEELKEKFLALSATVHPDRVHQLNEAERQQAQQSCTELNPAYNCLRDPRNRLRHLLELERGSVPKDIQQIPPDLMDVFMEVGQLCRQADAFLAEKDKVSSPLLKVQFFERGQHWTEKLRQLQNSITARRESLVEELKAIDARWESVTNSNPLEQLEKLYRLLGYFDRWLGQIQERLTRFLF